MAKLLLRIESCAPSSTGLEVRPCIPLHQILSRPEFRSLREGSAVELRRPDGTRVETNIVTYGAPGARSSDTTIFEVGIPRSQEWDIALTLAPSLRPSDVPPGTEIWSVE